MGYTTKFVGELLFAAEVSVEELRIVKEASSTEKRAEWEKYDPKNAINYIGFELNRGMTGIDWDGGEKFYGAVEAVNLITSLVRKVNPDFKFKGKLLAQGEDLTDRWALEIAEDGTARRVDIAVGARKVCRPSCEEEFLVEE